MRKMTFLLLLFIIFGTPLTSVGTSNIPSITNIFKDSEFVLEEANINGWVKLDEPCSDMDCMEKNGLAVFNDISEGESSISVNGGNKAEVNLNFSGSINPLMKSLKLSKNNSSYFCGFNEVSDKVAGYNAVVNKGIDQISIKGENKDSNISVTVKTIHNKMLGKYETLIIADVTQHQDMMNITDIRESIYNCLDEYGSNPNVNIFVTKYIEGCVDISHRKDILHKGLGLVNAEEVEYMEDDNIISISGYSKHLPYSIKSGDRFININLSCRYSPFDDKTYFWLGTPVINAEY